MSLLIATIGSEALAQRPPPRTIIAEPNVEYNNNKQVSGLFRRIQALEKQLRILQGLIEIQQREIDQLKRRHQNYSEDFDRRLNDISTHIANNTKQSSESNDKSLYYNAKKLLDNLEYTRAIDAFEHYLSMYADGKYVPNAHYWLGELFMVVTPKDIDRALSEFNMVRTQFPNHPKAPDAMYKNAKILHQQNKNEEAKLLLQSIIKEYAHSNSSSVKLSKDYLEKYF